jgi:hypothetical protein
VEVKKTKLLIPEFKSEAEEAEWLYQHRDQLDAQWKLVRDRKGKLMTDLDVTRIS